MDKVKVWIDCEDVKTYIIEFANEEDAHEAYELAVDWIGAKFGIHDTEELYDNQILVVCTNEVLHRFTQEIAKEIEWE